MTPEYAKVLEALENNASIDRVKLLLDAQAHKCLDEADKMFGLTISMRAAAHGRLDAVEAARERNASVFMQNEMTSANLLHYAALQPKRGAEIIKWAVQQRDAPGDLLTQRILVEGTKRKDGNTKWDRGNGHTVAFEAVFNSNFGAIKALLEIEKAGHNVDLETPAVHGWRPMGWALNNWPLEDSDARQAADLLRDRLHPNTADSEALAREEAAYADDYARGADEIWRSGHSDEKDALDLAVDLRNYVLKGERGATIEELLNRRDVDPNLPYGRFGQPLLILVPTDPSMMKTPKPSDQQQRYAKVVCALLEKKADPRVKEKGLMEVSAGYREIFFEFFCALPLIFEKVGWQVDFLDQQGLFNGYTRLIDAALTGKTKAIEILLSHSVDRGIRGLNGWTARDAAQRGIPGVILARLGPGSP